MHDLTAEVFEFFKDGEWHTLEDVQETFNVGHSVAEEVIRFLVDYRLLRLNADGSRAMIDEEILQILESKPQRDDFTLNMARRLKRKSSD